MEMHFNFRGISLILPSVLSVAPPVSQYVIVFVLLHKQTRPSYPLCCVPPLSCLLPWYRHSVLRQRKDKCVQQQGQKIFLWEVLLVLASLLQQLHVFFFFFFFKYTKTIVLMIDFFQPLSPPSYLSQASIVTVIHLVNSVVDTVEGEGTLSLFPSDSSLSLVLGF